MADEPISARASGMLVGGGGGLPFMKSAIGLLSIASEMRSSNILREPKARFASVIKSWNWQIWQRKPSLFSSLKTRTSSLTKEYLLATEEMHQQATAVHFIVVLHCIVSLVATSIVIYVCPISWYSRIPSAAPQKLPCFSAKVIFSQ